MVEKGDIVYVDGEGDIEFLVIRYINNWSDPLVMLYNLTLMINHGMEPARKAVVHIKREAAMSVILDRLNDARARIATLDRLSREVGLLPPTKL